MAEAASEQPVEESLSLEDQIANIYDKSGDQPEPEEVQEDVAGEPEVDEADDGGDEEVYAATDEPTEEPEFEEIEYDGVTYNVPPVLKDALMRQSDYTQKTQQLSEQRKAIELQAEEFKQLAAEREFLNSIQEEQLQLQQINATLQQYGQLNWAEMSTEEMMQHQVQRQNLKERGEELMQALQGKQQEFINKRAETHQEYLNKAKEYLKSNVGKWDEELAREVSGYMLNTGVPQAEVNAMINPIYVTAFYKAMQYDKLKSDAKKTVRKVQDAPVIKPKGHRPMPESVKKDLNYRKKIASLEKQGADSHEIAAVIREKLADRFA